MIKPELDEDVPTAVRNAAVVVVVSFSRKANTASSRSAPNVSYFQQKKKKKRRRRTTCFISSNYSQTGVKGFCVCKNMLTVSLNRKWQVLDELS